MSRARTLSDARLQAPDRGGVGGWTAPTPPDAARNWPEHPKTGLFEPPAHRSHKAKLGRLRAAAEEFATYLCRNARQPINYGERHRAGERISTGFVESAVNQVVLKRISKRQSMRWTQAGAHLALQARTRVLNGELEGAFRRRWPGFQPLPKARLENAGFGPPAPPVAPVL